LDHSFWEKMKFYRAARAEFARFVIHEEPELLKKFIIVDNNAELQKWYKFYVSATKDIGSKPIINSFSSVLQISSGLGITGRYDRSGKWLRESGLTLVYSFGFNGEVAVILYPFKSDGDNWKPKEENILLAVVPSNANKLRKRVTKDLSSMVAYGHVTSINGNPTLRQKIHIKWLRFFCAQNIDQKWQGSKKDDLILKGLSAAGSGSFAGIFKYGWPIFLAYILVKCG